MTYFSGVRGISFKGCVLQTMISRRPGGPGVAPVPPPPLATPIEPGSAYARSPSPEPPISRKKDTPPPPISGIGYHWHLQKTPPFPVFSGNLPETTTKKKIPRKWECACGPLMHSSGGGGQGAGVLRPAAALPVNFLLKNNYHRGCWKGSNFDVRTLFSNNTPAPSTLRC